MTIPRLRPARLLTATTLAFICLAAPAKATQTPRQMEWPLDYFHADQVWQHGAGQGVTVAVVDTGVDARHADLAGQVEPGASFGGAGTDGSTDSDGHGTGMASLIAGTGSGYGGAGIKGLAYQARILPVAVSVTGHGEASNSAQGIRYAADHGAKVINISSGGTNDVKQEHAAISYALAHDAVVVAAAGNAGDKDNHPEYPAADAGVVAVGGVSQDGQPWAGSEYGPQIVLTAPATDQEAADLNGYGIGTGTSPATAWVSGAAAVVRGLHPDWTAGQTIRQLINTAHKPDGSHTRDDHYGYGIVDPLAAVTTPLAPGPTTNPLLAAGDNSQGQGAGGDGNQAAPAPQRGNTLRLAAIGVGTLSALALGGIIVAVLIAKQRRKQPPPTFPTGWPPGPPR